MLITKEDVFLIEESYNKDSILKYISKKAEEQGITSNADDVYNDFVSREKEYSTAVVDHVAIPHAKSKYVNESKVFFLKLKEEIDWDSPEDYKVGLIFAILVPEEDAGTTHLKIISTIAEKLLDENFIATLQRLTNKEEILKYILK